MDRIHITEQIVRARAMGNHALAEQLEAQLMAMNIFVAPSTPRERDLRAIPEHRRNSEQRFHWPPPYDTSNRK